VALCDERIPFVTLAQEVNHALMSDVSGLSVAIYCVWSSKFCEAHLVYDMHFT